MDVEVDFHFSAAHRLPYYDGPCSRMHGHNYQLRVIVSGELEPKSGMVVDFLLVQRAVEKEILPGVDHRVLNELMDNPTAENMLVWMWERLHKPLPGLKELRLWETPQYCVTFRGP
jgi:6-pyruvoyltetrahydropterin/6-carboxytetrahydropterin synthase